MFKGAQTAVERLLSEIANKIKTTNQELCCLTSGSGDFEYVPIYEYRWVFLDNLSPTGRFNFTISGTQVTFNFVRVANSASLCDETSGNVSNTLTYWEYSDSVGHVINDINQTEYIVVDFAEFPNKEITYRFNLGYANGYKISGIASIITDNSGVPTVSYGLTPIQSNSNANDLMNPSVFLRPIKDLLEVRQAGTFIKYVDTDHNDYVPTCMLSYDPIPPFAPLNFELQPVRYDNYTHTLVSGSIFSIPANTVHSIDYTVLNGSVDMEINLISALLTTGVSASIQATNLIDQDITFNAATSGDSVYIILNKA